MEVTVFFCYWSKNLSIQSKRFELDAHANCLIFVYSFKKLLIRIEERLYCDYNSIDADDI